MPEEIEQIDLSEFGLDGSAIASASPPAALSDDSLPKNVLQELGMEDFGQPAAATNGQTSADPSQVAETDTFAGLPESLQPSSVAARNLDRREVPMPELPKLTPQSTAPSTGFGLFEQILLELTRLNLEMAGLRQTLQSLGATGPSVLASARGAQRTTSVSPSVEGDASNTVRDESPRPRRRGRPKKEESEFGLE